MNFLKNLFGMSKNADSKGRQENITPEEFFNTDYIKAILNKYRRSTTLLLPYKSEKPIGHDQSKFGGIPNFSGFEVYPFCDSCNAPLNFVLQLYKGDFPDFYFPANSILFQLFRCPNYQCPETGSEEYDQKMFHYYFLGTNDTKVLTKPIHELADAEREVPDCYLKPKVKDDFPNFDDFEGNDFIEIEERFGDDMGSLFMDNYSAAPNSKFGGYPGYTQSPNYPVCTCGRAKEFFFQLSSEDIEEGEENSKSQGVWSAHGIMIGDVGNIYYYVCKPCGPSTIESNWDCF